jgi:tetratricopeptide (TPR) repeat protein
VYALGVVLFQLATGGLPYDLHGVSILEATSIVQERRPPKLERFSPALSKGERRELDTIIERAMAKQRDHRYSGVAELSADIRRFLNHEPIEARPLGRVYRLRKLTRKHRGIVIASSFAVLALIAGSVVSTIEAIRAMRMQRKAETKERLAVGVNDFYRDQILGRANPNRTMKSGPNTTLGEAVDLAALEVSTSFPDDPLLQAAVHESLGEAYAGMGRQSDAQREFQQALEVYKSQLGMEAPETSEVSFHLATSYRLDGKLAEAEPLYQIVLNIRERTLGPDAAETCVAMVGLATMYHDLSRWNAAIGLLEPAVGGMTNVLGGSDIDTIQARMYLASCYLATGKPEQAENLFRDSLTRLRATVGDEHPDTTNCMSSLGMLLSRAGKHDDALALIREAADINRRTLGADHPDSLSSLELEALALESKGDLNAALQIHEEGVELCRSSTLLTRGDYANTLSKLAGCLTKLQRYQEAEEALLEAYPITVEAFGPDHYRTRRAVNNLVKLYRSTGRPVQSREWESRLPAAQ